MQIHRYNLKEIPFLRIKEWKKKIEIRLYDEKRKKIALHDTIIFSNKKYWEIEKTVVWLHYYNDFSDLIKSYPTMFFWPTKKEDLLNRLFTYYTKEQEKEFWVIAIHLD